MRNTNGNGGPLGFEASLWAPADKLRNNMDAAEYKVVAGCSLPAGLRDALLPKLLSGEIRVGEAKQRVEERV